MNSRWSQSASAKATADPPKRFGQGGGAKCKEMSFTRLLPLNGSRIADNLGRGIRSTLRLCASASLR